MDEKSPLGVKLQAIIDDPVVRYHVHLTAWRQKDNGAVFSIIGDRVEYQSSAITHEAPAA